MNARWPRLLISSLKTGEFESVIDFIRAPAYRVFRGKGGNWHHSHNSGRNAKKNRMDTNSGELQALYPDALKLQRVSVEDRHV